MRKSTTVLATALLAAVTALTPPTPLDADTGLVGRVERPPCVQPADTPTDGTLAAIAASILDALGESKDGREKLETAIRGCLGLADGSELPLDYFVEQPQQG